MEAIYSLHLSKMFACRIPKKNGKGFLKAAFGGHHNSPECVNWNPPVVKNSHCFLEADIDGYLLICFQLNSWDEGYEQIIENLKQSLIEIFPRITSWREVSFMEVAES